MERILNEQRARQGAWCPLVQLLSVTDYHSRSHTELCGLLECLPVQLLVGSEQEESQLLLPECHPTRVAFEKLC